MRTAHVGPRRLPHAKHRGVERYKELMQVLARVHQIDKIDGMKKAKDLRASRE
jgi:hypothetical protein